MRQFNSLGNRVIALALSIFMLIGMMPTSVFAVSPSTLTTDISEKTFVVGETTEFTFTTTANGDAGKYVLGTFEFSDPSAVEKLEYLESQTGTWYEFYGDFGPVGTGFPMTDATSQFRVSFNKAGDYTVKASMVTADGRNELCSVTKTISVARANPSVLTTNIGEVPFVAGKSAEFTFTTTANEDAGTYVLGTFVFSDPSAVEKLEYRESQTGNWYEFNGDFGPAGTGFPMTNATSQFRVTFNKVGTYSVTASMVTADNRTVLCSTTQEVTVSKDVSTLTTNIGNKTFVIGKTTEFTFTTTANADAGTYVFGTFEFSDPSAVAKLEYLESQTGTWYEFYGDFGPAGTGFPMTNATSQFRVTFNKVGTYTVKASMVTANDRTVLCSVEKTVTVADTSKLTTNIEQQSFVTGQTTEFTFTTTANGDAGTYVLGSFVFSDPSAIEKLEYLEVQSGQWFEFYGDFGPAGTGFPMTNATSQFRVTFKKAGNYTLTASMKTVADGTVLCEAESNVIVAASEQTGFAFESTNPVDQWIGNTYKNVAVGGQTNETIIYEIVDGPATIAADGTVTFTGLGAVTVKATRPGNEFYKAVSATYVVTSVKNAWEPFGFAVSNPTITYAPNLTYPNANLKNDLVGLDSTVTFAIVNGGSLVLSTDVATIDPATGVLTILKSGVVTVRATRAADTLYTEATAEYTVTVEKADQTIAFETVTEVDELTYQTGAIALPSITGKLSEKDIVYTITVGDGEVAKIEDGKLQLLKSGYFEMTIVVPTDDRYEESNTLTWKVTVNKANQTGFDFAADNDTITYNDVDKNAASGLANEYTVITSGGQSTGAVTYEVVDGDAAIFNKYGVLTIKKAGTVKIKATKAGDEKYNATESYFELTVEKDEQSFTFNHNKQINEKYGLTSFETQITKSELNSGAVTYAVSGDNIGATVNNQGVVSFGNSTLKVGTITVTVTMVENDCYLPFTETYTITLSYETTPAAPYALHGDKIINGSAWFTGDVSIYAPNDYQISYSNDLTGNEWKNYVEWKVDGEAGTWAAGSEPVVYLKNTATGAITDAIPVNDLKRDTVRPNGLAISYDVSVLATIGEKIFGFNASTVKVTVTAADSLSGISKMEYSKDGGATYTEITANNGKYEFDVESQYRGQLWIRATDVAGNAEIYKHLDNNTDKILVVDHTAPGLTVGYTGGMNDAATSGIRYVKSDKVTVVFEITDENFDLRAADPIVTVNGVAKTDWVYDATSGTLTFDLADEGDYKIEASFSDRLSREVTYEAEVRVDRTKPVIESTIVDGKYYTENQTFVLTITEHNFDAAKVNLVVNAVDSKNNKVLTDAEIQAFADLAKNPDKWVSVSGTDKHQLTLDITKDGNYTVSVDCSDNLAWAADTHTRTFTVDKVNPNQPTLKYEVGTAKSDLLIETILNKLFGFAKETTVVTVQSGDATSGIDRLEYKLHNDDNFTVVNMDADGKYSFNLDPEYRGVITVVVYDKAGRSTTTVEQKEIVVDSIAPDVVIEFTGDRQDAVKADNGNTITRETMSTPDATTRFIYNGNVTATIKVKEVNFFKEIDMPITVIRDEQVVTTGFTDSGWSNEPNADGYYVRTIVLQDDGDYRINASYRDHSLNDMEWDSNEYAQSGVYSYESNIHTIDTKAPVYEVTYDNNEVIQTLNGRDYFKAGREATIKVTDRNFRPNEVVFNVTATDIAGNAVTYTYSNLKSWSDWTKGADGITWTAKVPFAPDANYTVNFSYDDLANHKMVNKDNVEEVYNAEFTVDTKIPTGLKVEYKSKDAQVLNKILNAITFGNYKAAQEVVLTMTDATAGIDYIELTVTPEGPASATNLVMPENLVVNADGSVKSGTKGFIGTIRSSANNGDLTLSFDVPAQFRGKISFVAYDKSSNHSDSHADPGVLVVDTIAPGHTISYNPSNVVNVSDMKDMTDFNAANGITDITSKDASYVMYFSGDAVAKIEIAEANFDPSEVILVVQDANGNAVQGWTQTDWVTTTKAGEADVHTKTVTIAAEGDYQIKVYYQDHSMNTPVDYLSQWIVVDKTAPVIDVKYSNTDIKNTIENRDYFSAAQTATITIKEHNFRADDVVIKVTAKDVLDADVLTLNADGTVKAYADQGADRKSWTSYEAGTWRVKDDAFIITLNYTTDANYTFDIEYQDLAKNVAADYEQDLFTVDVTAPKNLTVDYSTSVFEQIKESITFGYYNAMMTVTITAEDDTSGIYHFAYSYIKGKDVSGVNAELLDQAIKEAEITYDGKKATATFNIPKMVLGADNQFNGTVEFTAFDRSEVSTELKDSTVIVVDNITPTSKITYNAPVQTANGISYYDGDINATIVVTEANFDAKDVVVTVTKDGENFPVNVSWRDDSVDTHTGTFTLTKDGDYIVSVQYKDKSGNQMTSYKSNELTLDATKPTIKVSNIKANSANKDEKYGFVITVNDTNLDASSLKPVLKAVVQKEEGVYVTVDIDLGNAKTVVNGQTYTYTVEDLPDDGLYTLTCSVKDMSSNGMSQIVLDDSESYDQVQFSINRNGSAFGYGNKFSEELVGQYYIYSVDEDVVIVEVNVDPIEEYKVTLNGKELVEGTDYTTIQTSKDGEWSKRTYTIKKALFESEGEYSIIVSSTDKADTTAFSDVKNLSLAFVVDQTKPVLTITGLEAGGRYQTDAQTVTLIPTDEGGRLNSLTVLVMDSNGNPLKDDAGADISVRFEMAGEELLKHLEDNDGKVTFTIPEGLNNQVKIICNDCAVNAEDLTNEYNELFERVTVSQNQFVIFYANTPLFVGTIAGVLAVAGLIVFLVKRKGSKKSKAKA